MAEVVSAVTAFFARPLVRELITAVIMAVITALIARLATRALRHLLRADTTPLPSSSIIVNIARATVWIVGGSAILNTCFGINTNSLVAALGVGGIAVSLGFQDTLSNLIGGLQVTFMGLVRPGDNIEVGAEAGVVQDVTWRHTTIKDALGQVVVIPNSVIAKTAIVHLLPANRVAVPFSVPRYREGGAEGAAEAGADAGASSDSEATIDALAERIADESRRAVEAVCPLTDGPRVLFSEITELGIQGKVILTVADAAQTSAAADAVVRAIAQLIG